MYSYGCFVCIIDGDLLKLRKTKISVFCADHLAGRNQGNNSKYVSSDELLDLTLYLVKGEYEKKKTRKTTIILFVCKSVY